MHTCLWVVGEYPREHMEDMQTAHRNSGVGRPRMFELATRGLNSCLFCYTPLNINALETIMIKVVEKEVRFDVEAAGQT